MRHRRAMLVLSAVGLIVLVGGVWFIRVWQQRGPDEASIDDALDRYRASSTTPGPTEPTPTGPTDYFGTRPRPGVYTYHGEGREGLSFLETDQAQGPTMPATITWSGDRCWTFALEYNSFHTQRWNWCLDDRGVIETGGSVDQAFDFAAFAVDEHSVSTCDPPSRMVLADAEPGTAWPTRCETTSSTTNASNVSAGTNTFAGDETIVIDGRRRVTMHYRFEATISGGQTGDDVLDLWFDRETLVLVKGQRDLRVTSPAPAPLNEVTYTESGTFTIESLEPAA